MTGGLQSLLDDWHLSRGKGTTIALVDSGVDASHPGLSAASVEGVVLHTVAGNIIAERDAVGDLAGHGTACAGRILTLAPESRILSCRVLSSSLASTSRLLLGALEWLLTRDDVDVVNLSLGTPNRAFGLEIAHAVDQFYARGICVVASAGPAERPDYPAMFSGPVSVEAAACSDDEELVYRRGSIIEFGARGIDVPVLWSGGRRASVSGSSFAAPLVAGRLARFKALRRNLSVWEQKTLLQYQALTGRPEIR
ncbi:S8 family serine peptidase [Candidatus Sumerlaeota bacterium]|nr:S8 family serine peptidase [Candidatus Sumerlaeota bacterium]